VKFCEVHKAGGREGRAISAGHLYALAFDSGPISGAGFWDLGSGIPVLSCPVDCASCGGTGVFAGQIACDEDSQASISQSLPLAMAMPLSLTELDSLSLFRAVFPSLSRRPTPVSFGFSSSVSVGFADTVSVFTAVIDEASMPGCVLLYPHVCVGLLYWNCPHQSGI